VLDARETKGDTADGKALYVLSGELVVETENETYPAERNTWVYVPPGVAYAITALGDVEPKTLHIDVSNAVSGDEHVVVCRAGGTDGDTITDRPGRRATVLVESRNITISEFDYGPGERGAKPHVHREHTDGFFVVEGEFTFHFRDGSRGLPAGTLLVIPPGVVHGFDNDGDARARCFNFHFPSFGFADYMRGKNPDFDQFEPPEDGGLSPDDVFIVPVELG
jgi:quercetin dioxygenase-like cupin family protein